MLFLHWFYKGCPRNMVFYIGFTRKTRGQLADNPDMVLAAAAAAGAAAAAAAGRKLASQQP